MTSISSMAADLRYLRRYADSHRVFDLGLLDEAAHLIDELVGENTGLREENAELNAQLNLWLEEAEAA